MQLLARIALLLSVLLMPFGMTAAASASPHHAAGAEMPMGHCSDEGQPRDMKGGIAECTMACAGALPAAVPVPGDALLATSDRLIPVAPRGLPGLHPETATPPPKRA